MSKLNLADLCELFVMKTIYQLNLLILELKTCQSPNAKETINNILGANQNGVLSFCTGDGIRTWRTSSTVEP